MKSPFALEPYLLDVRDRTAWAPDLPIENYTGPAVPRPVLYRIAHLWTLALLDDRFDTLLLPVLVTRPRIIENLALLPRAFAEERLQSGACLLFLDGPHPNDWPQNRAFLTINATINSSCP
jgi:hypothetical protein